MKLRIFIQMFCSNPIQLFKLCPMYNVHEKSKHKTFSKLDVWSLQIVTAHAVLLILLLWFASPYYA